MINSRVGRYQIFQIYQLLPFLSAVSVYQVTSLNPKLRNSAPKTNKSVQNSSKTSPVINNTTVQNIINDKHRFRVMFAWTRMFKCYVNPSILQSHHHIPPSSKKKGGFSNWSWGNQHESNTRQHIIPPPDCRSSLPDTFNALFWCHLSPSSLEDLLEIAVWHLMYARKIYIFFHKVWCSFETMGKFTIYEVKIGINLMLLWL